MYNQDESEGEGEKETKRRKNQLRRRVMFQHQHRQIRLIRIQLSIQILRDRMASLQADNSNLRGELAKTRNELDNNDITEQYEERAVGGEGSGPVLEQGREESVTAWRADKSASILAQGSRGNDGGGG
eukprot:767684-Hanusia_phi.AAC.3